MQASTATALDVLVLWCHGKGFNFQAHGGPPIVAHGQNSPSPAQQIQRPPTIKMLPLQRSINSRSCQENPEVFSCLGMSACVTAHKLGLQGGAPADTSNTCKCGSISVLFLIGLNLESHSAKKESRNQPFRLSLSWFCCSIIAYSCHRVYEATSATGDQSIHPAWHKLLQCNSPACHI